MFDTLNEEQIRSLHNEVVSERARLRLTRHLRHAMRHDEAEIIIIWQNRAINIARNILGLPIYVLDAGEDGYYHPAENAWHNGELELVMRRPDTVQLAETLIDLLNERIILLDNVNAILNDDNVSFTFYEVGHNEGFNILISPLEDIDDAEEDEHPNIRKLINRMDTLNEQNDFAGALHAGASIFETLAKQIVDIETVQNRSLGSFFDRYKNDSALPDAVVDYIQEIFQRRNTEPIAGHGHLEEPEITREDAILLAEMTKAFVRVERKLFTPELDL